MQQFEWVRSFHGLLDLLTEAERYPKDISGESGGICLLAGCPIPPSVLWQDRVGFFCFIVSKIERKDTGVLLLFCVGVPGAGARQDQAWLHSGTCCLGTGGVRSVPVMPMALGAGLMMMMVKSLCPKWVSAGGRQELEAL